MSSITLDRTQATEDEVKSAMRCIVVFQEVASLMRGEKNDGAANWVKKIFWDPSAETIFTIKKPTVLILVFITLEDH